MQPATHLSNKAEENEMEMRNVQIDLMLGTCVCMRVHVVSLTTILVIINFVHLLGEPTR